MAQFKPQAFLMDVEPLANEMVFAHYFDQVSPDRQGKIKALKSTKARALSLGAGLVLKILLEKCSIDPTAPMIRNNNGKLFLKDREDCYFNLSHSGHFVVGALAPEAIGIDIQKIKKANVKLAKRFFHDQEYTFLLKLASESQDLGFSQIWAAKESYIKYLGTGLATPLNSFQVQFEIDKSNWTAKIQGQDLYFKNVKGPEDYVIWSCSESDGVTENLEKLSLKGVAGIGWENK